MNEREVRQLLPAYLDGSLSADEKAAVQAALDGSADLGRELEQWRSLRGCVRRVTEAEAVPAGLCDCIAGKIAQARGSLLWRRIGAMAAVATAAMIVIGVAMWQFNWLGTRPSGANPGSSSTARYVSIDGDEFARLFLACRKATKATAHHEDLVADAKLLNVKLIPPKGFLTDATGRTYELCETCSCMKIKSVNVLLAHYHNTQDPSDALTVFTLSKQVRMQACRKWDSTKCKSGRGYEIKHCDDVNVVKWDESSTSYAIASGRSTNELIDLAETVDIAAHLDGTIRLTLALGHP
jgi:anti-sigma factor RsiW